MNAPHQDRDAENSDLKHQYALLDEELLCAPNLQSAYGRESRHPELRRVLSASKNRHLRCAVCGSILKRMFGSVKRWHFARFPGQIACDHENETVAHRRSKMALYEALSYSLGLEWNVSLEKRLPNGRRPDVLATHFTGSQVAFEVQYSDLSEEEFESRYTDYRNLGIRDVWLLGDKRQEQERDGLRDLLAATQDQRIIYIGLLDDTDEVTAQEAVFGNPKDEEFGITGYLKPGSVSSKSIEGVWEDYSLQSISLGPDGTLHTPADLLFEQLQRHAEVRRRAEMKRREDERVRRQERHERQRKKAEQQRERQKNKEEALERKRIAEQEQRRCEDARWKESPKREFVLSTIGEELLAMFEVEREEDLHIYRPPGYWKSALYLSCIHGKPPKSSVDWFEVMKKALKCPHDRKRQAHYARGAVYRFRSLLEREELIEFVRKDDRGYKRFWQTPPSQEEKQRIEKAHVEAIRAEQNRIDQEKNTRREILLKRFQENTSSRKPRLPKADRARSTPFVEFLSPDQRAQREAAKARWLDSDDRRVLVEKVGTKLLNVLESDGDTDRYILVHPGEWKGLLYVHFVHGKPSGEKLNVRAMTGLVLQKYAVGDRSKTAVATIGFLDTICTKNAGLNKTNRNDYIIATPAKIWR